MHSVLFLLLIMFFTLAQYCHSHAADPCGNRTDYIYKPEFEICYKIYPSPQQTTVDSLINECAKDGAELIKINSQKVQDFFAQELDKLQESFNVVPIQGNDRLTEGTWKYDDGSPLSYFLWDEDQPDEGQPYGASNQDVIVMRRATNYKWHDFVSSRQFLYVYVCQIKAM